MSEEIDAPLIVNGGKIRTPADMDEAIRKSTEERRNLVIDAFSDMYLRNMSAYLNAKRVRQQAVFAAYPGLKKRTERGRKRFAAQCESRRRNRRK